jgi:hypothetical protein
LFSWLNKWSRRANSCEETGYARCAINEACGPRPLACSRFEIAMSTDLIFSGTDVKPLECPVFLRDVRSRLYFERMKAATGLLTPSTVTPRKVNTQTRGSRSLLSRCSVSTNS